MRVPNRCWFLFYFYRKMSLLPSTLHVAIAAWHCLVLNNACILPNCSLAWLSNKSHLNGWMIGTTRQHFEGILVLFHSGSGQEEVTREMVCWHCTYYRCGVGLPACVFTVDGNQKGIIVMRFDVLQQYASRVSCKRVNCLVTTPEARLAGRPSFPLLLCRRRITPLAVVIAALGGLLLPERVLVRCSCCCVTIASVASFAPRPCGVVVRPIYVILQVTLHRPRLSAVLVSVLLHPRLPSRILSVRPPSISATALPKPPDQRRPFRPRRRPARLVQ